MIYNIILIIKENNILIKTTNEETSLTHVRLSFTIFPLNYVNVAAYYLLKFIS